MPTDVSFVDRFGATEEGNDAGLVIRVRVS
jgi:hypothetical protein